MKQTKNPLSDNYNNVYDYCIVGNCLCHIKNESDCLPLVNGALAITKQITANNGIENTIFFEISATDANGNLLPPCRVESRQFTSLNWIIENYGCRLPFSPNQSTKQRIINALLLSGKNATSETVYTNTGYLYKTDELTGEKLPCNYLYYNGDIASDKTVKTDIISNLHRYRLTPVEKKYDTKSVLASLELLKACNPDISYPLLAFTYLPVVRPWIESAIGDTSFCIYLKGKTQSGKSTLASLVMSHYGQFESYTPPCSFNATYNAIQELSFILKDSIFWIDDFIPRYDKAEMKKQNLIMQNIARYVGDNASRLKLNSDSTIRNSHPSRCFYLITGEDNLQIGQSGQARIFTMELDHNRNDIAVLIDNARNGILSKSVYQFIRFVCEGYDGGTFKKKYDEILAQFERLFGSCRLSKQGALLVASLHSFIHFAKTIGAIESDKAKQILLDGTKHIINACQNSQSEIQNNDAESQYITALTDILASGQKYLLNLLDDTRTDFTLGTDKSIIGYYDNDYLYLDSNLTYKAVCDYWNNENQYFGISKSMIQKQLYKSGFIVGQNGQIGTVKNIRGKSVRVIRIRKQSIEINTISE